MRFSSFCFVILLIVTMATGKIVKGIDSFHPLSLDTLKCFKKHGYYFVIVRAYRSFGAVDKNAL